MAAANTIRKSHGLRPLDINPQLQSAAEYQAGLMAYHDKISHKITRGESLRERGKRAGYPYGVGENLSAGRTSLDAVLDGWMKSDGHRANLLREDYRNFGLAYARVTNGHGSRYGVYWAMVFGL
jgi:uncharacterized protein YkwD